jgi:hypothetical protein
LYNNAADPNAVTGFAYDYMLKDHLGNVRMVLTEEQKQDIYPAATLESVTYNGGTAISVEDDYYSVTAANVVNQSDATGIPVYQNTNVSPANTINLRLGQCPPKKEAHLDVFTQTIGFAYPYLQSDSS